MRLIALIVNCLIIVSATKVGTNQAFRGIAYPDARRNESVVDDFFGTKVADPYRWLEDPYSEETKQFIGAQNQLSQSILTRSGKWKEINEKLTAYWNYSKFDVPQRIGKYYFSSRNTGLQNQNVLYKQKSFTDEGVEFLNPNSLSDDGTTAVPSTSFSPDGSIMAYALSEFGSDWAKIKFRNVESGKDYLDTLKGVKHAYTLLAWTHDNKGLFYSRYERYGDGTDTDVNINQKLYYHRVGERQEKDDLVVEFLDQPRWPIKAVVSSCGKYLIVIPRSGAKYGLYFADLNKNGPITGKIPLTPIIKKPDAIYQYITNTESKVVFFTSKNAPNNRLVVIDFEDFAEENWRTLVKEHPHDVLRLAEVADDEKIIISYIHDVKSTLQVNSLTSGELIRKFPLDAGQIVRIFEGEKSSEIFYQFESYLTPGIIYRYDFSTPDVEPTVFREMKLNLSGFDENDFKVEQVFYSSRDGTKIPMYIMQRKTSSDLPKPCLLYAYGGFNLPTLPEFSAPFLFFVQEFDGVVAVANIRGGGEYGKKWHDAGCSLHKQNSFDDFQAAAEYLIEEKYTERKKIAIKGMSNGGLLVAACINQRPDLFGAAIAQVGAMDMIRAHKFTIGEIITPEYGDPREKIHFENIYKYSPLHNVHSPNSTENQYPPTLITTADHDNRACPLHSLKLTATLQYAVRNNQFQKNPILLRIYKNAGHEEGNPTAKVIEEETDINTFLYEALQINNSS